MRFDDSHIPSFPNDPNIQCGLTPVQVKIMSKVLLEGLHKYFGAVHAVQNVTLEIKDGEFAVLVGPSGCGKTTTLRMVAGLEEVSRGTIKFDDKVVNSLPPKSRDIAMVFQSYALYPHLTTAENMAFGLKMRGRPKSEIAEAVQRAAALLNISELLDRKPRELSGGQRQRVAMGRAIVRRPRGFLFDEPLSNLDAALRVEMRVEIKKLHQSLKTTIIYVTHDQVEAMTLADKIVVMNKGEIVQVGEPLTVYRRPTTKFIAGFIGSPKMNFIPCRLLETSTGGLAAEPPDGTHCNIPDDRVDAYRPYLNRPLEIGLRPQHLTLGGPELANTQYLESTVDVVEPTGSETLISFTIKGHVMTAFGNPNVAKNPGQRIRLQAQMDHMHLIDPQNEQIVAV